MSGRDTIKILQLGSPTGLYGAERWILALANHLPSKRAESYVAVIKDSEGPEPPLCKYAESHGFRVHIFDSQGRLSLSAIDQIRRFVRKHEIDILHTHGYKTDIIGRLATFGTGCAIVATPHGWSTSAGFKVSLYEMLDRVCFLSVDAVAPLSLGLYTELAAIPGLRGKLHLIENGIDLSEIEAVGCSLDIWEPSSDGQLTVGYIGQLIARKRIDTLIRAFHSVELPKARLWIVGDGSERASLEELVVELGESERVTFFGYRADRLKLLRRCDVFVLASEHEGIPRCLMEAMALGIPVVAADIPGCRELVESGVTGLLFEPGNNLKLAELLRVLLDDRPVRVSIGAAGKEFVRLKYSARTMAIQYLELYEKLACGARARKVVEGGG